MTTKPSKNHCRDAAMVLVGVSAFAEQMSREPTPNHARCGINQAVVHVMTRMVYALKSVTRLYSTLLLLDQIKPIGPLVPVN